MINFKNMNTNEKILSIHTEWVKFEDRLFTLFFGGFFVLFLGTLFFVDYPLGHIDFFDAALGIFTFIIPIAFIMYRLDYNNFKKMKFIIKESFSKEEVKSILFSKDETKHLFFLGHKKQIYETILNQIFSTHLSILDVQEIITYLDNNLHLLNTKQRKKIKNILPKIKNMLESNHIDYTLFELQPFLYKINKKLYKLETIEQPNHLEKYAL